MPRLTDALLVDTNVWYWAIWTRAILGSNPPSPAQLSEYPHYLLRTQAYGATRYRSGLCLAELAHLIEQTERDIYVQSRGSISAKEYRHNIPSERAAVVAEIQGTWGSIKAVSSPLPVTIDDPATDAALTSLGTQLLDGYDLFLLAAMQAGGVLQILTDDGDFCTVPGIQVFTANANVIAAATAQGHLLVR